MLRPAELPCSLAALADDDVGQPGRQGRGHGEGDGAELHAGESFDPFW